MQREGNKLPLTGVCPLHRGPASACASRTSIAVIKGSSYHLPEIQATSNINRLGGRDDSISSTDGRLNGDENSIREVEGGNQNRLSIVY